MSLDEWLEHKEEIGLAKGRTEGRAEGREEQAINSAKQMLHDNLDVELISKYTGLSLEVINQLKQN